MDFRFIWHRFGMQLQTYDTFVVALLYSSRDKRAEGVSLGEFWPFYCL